MKIAPDCDWKFREKSIGQSYWTYFWKFFRDEFLTFSNPKFPLRLSSVSPHKLHSSSQNFTQAFPHYSIPWSVLSSFQVHDYDWNLYHLLTSICGFLSAPSLCSSVSPFCANIFGNFVPLVITFSFQINLSCWVFLFHQLSIQAQAFIVSQINL